jgi:hypothetical protein
LFGNLRKVIIWQQVLRHTKQRYQTCAREVGLCGFGIQRQLAQLQINCVVLNAADIPKSDKDKRQKK